MYRFLITALATLFLCGFVKAEADFTIIPCDIKGELSYKKTDKGYIVMVINDHKDESLKDKRTIKFTYTESNTHIEIKNIRNKNLYAVKISIKPSSSLAGAYGEGSKDLYNKMGLLFNAHVTQTSRIILESVAERLKLVIKSEAKTVTAPLAKDFSGILELNFFDFFKNGVLRLQPDILKKYYWKKNKALYVFIDNKKHGLIKKYKFKDGIIEFEEEYDIPGVEYYDFKKFIDFILEVQFADLRDRSKKMLLNMLEKQTK